MALGVRSAHWFVWAPAWWGNSLPLEKREGGVRRHANFPEWISHGCQVTELPSSLTCLSPPTHSLGGKQFTHKSEKVWCPAGDCTLYSGLYFTGFHVTDIYWYSFPQLEKHCAKCDKRWEEKKQETYSCGGKKRQVLRVIDTRQSIMRITR